MKLTNEEIADVFALYNKQGARHVGFMGTGGTNDKMYYVLDSVLNEDNEGDDVKTFDDWKLLLSRLEDITDEDADYIHRILGITENEAGYNTSVADVKKGIIENGLFALHLFDFYGGITEVFQWLLKKGYAVPLFFGLAHWANGKTAIELGIAIDKNKKG